MRGRLALLLMVAATPLAAQTVRGRVIDGEGGSALVGALVEVRDSTGQPLLRMLTTSSGGFAFMLQHPGPYALRVAAIGYIPLASRALTVPAGGTTVPDLAMNRAVFTLPDLVSAAKGKACGVDELGHGTFADVLESAHTALQVAGAALESQRLGFRVQLVNTRSLLGPNSVPTIDTANSGLTSWPLLSADLDSLRLGGFAREPTAMEPEGMIYYGPDARVLFADWFLDSHCFTLVVDHGKDSPDSVRMKFAPRGKPALVDLDGELVFDRETMSLRRLEFRHVNLPKGIPAGFAGGRIAFDRWDSGLWLPVSWSIWGPIESVRMAPPMPSRGQSAAVRPLTSRTVAGMARLSGTVLEVIRN